MHQENDDVGRSTAVDMNSAFEQDTRRYNNLFGNFFALLRDKFTR